MEFWEGATIRNGVKGMLSQGQVAIGTIVAALDSPGLMWMLATAGFDFVYLDAEHSCFSIETIGKLIMAARGAGIVPIVRPPAIDLHFVSRCLDGGALGVLVPHIETAEQVAAVVRACKYAPQGQRGIATRQFQTGYRPLTDVQAINEEIMVEIMIESRAAVERIEELVAVPGVDVVVIGLSDLAQDLGMRAESERRLVLEKADKVVRVCLGRGIALGLHASNPEAATEWIARGIRMLSYSSDTALVVDNARDQLARLRTGERAGQVGETPKTGKLC